MLIFENIALALNSIKTNIGRSVLTMLGIIIGVASVIGIITMGDALNSSLDGEMAGEMDNIYFGVSPKSDNRGRGGFRAPVREMSDQDYINAAMIEDVYSHFADRIECLDLEQNVSSEAKAIDGSKSANVSVWGYNATGLNAQDLKMSGGRVFTDEEYSAGKKTAIVSSLVVKYVYGGDMESAIGSDIAVLIDKKYYNYRVVGVYEYDSEDFMMVDESEISTQICIPLMTAMNQTHKYDKYEQFTIEALKHEDVETLTNDIAGYMNRRYYRDNAYFEISGFNMIQLMEEVLDVFNKIRLGLSLVAGISLLVGGIGVMNIMLVSITERTREIGTRKALGATNTSIRQQFVIESIVLCMVGGLIGTALGVGVGYIGCSLLKEKFVVSMFSIMLSVGFSAAVGVFFGYYPANKAAKMNPIDALRYE